jgi:hypothetical protein
MQAEQQLLFIDCWQLQQLSNRLLAVKAGFLCHIAFAGSG